MNRSREGGIDLTELERAVLALELIARLIEGDHLDWEDVPELTEMEFQAVEECMRAEAVSIRRRADLTGVDRQYVYGQIAP